MRSSIVCVNHAENMATRLVDNRYQSGTLNDLASAEVVHVVGPRRKTQAVQVDRVCFVLLRLRRRPCLIGDSAVRRINNYRPCRTKEESLVSRVRLESLPS